MSGSSLNLSNLFGSPAPSVALVALTALVLAVLALLVGVLALRPRATVVRTIARAGDAPRRFRWRIFGTSVLVAAISGFMTWLLLPDQYRAMAMILVESPNPRVPMQLVDPPVTEDAMNRFVQDQVEFLKHKEVLRDTLGDANVMATGWYRVQPDKSLILSKLARELAVRQVPGTNYVEVSFVADQPKDAATIVNTVVEKYLYRVQAMAQDQWETRLQRYAREEEARAERLQKITADQSALANQIKILEEGLRALAVGCTKAEDEEVQAKAEYDSMVKADPADAKLPPEVLLLIEQTPQVARLQQELLAIFQRPPTETQPAESLKARHDALYQQLKTLLAEKRQEYCESRIRAAKTRWLEAAGAAAVLREKMTEAEPQRQRLARYIVDHRGIEHDADLVKRELDLLHDYNSQVRLMIKDREIARVHRVAMATPPVEPFRDRPLILSGLATLAILLLGIALAIRPARPGEDKREAEDKDQAISLS